MATSPNPTRDDFAALLDESLGGADGGFCTIPKHCLLHSLRIAIGFPEESERVATGLL
jgi:hypothetical protein